MSENAINQECDTHVHALLIGINDWKFPKQIKPLKGCHNDVQLIESTLHKIFGATSTKAEKLFDQQATADGIVAAFKAHLIEPAKKWLEANPGKAHQSPAFLFHYSGHGTQVSAPADSKASGLDETLCTWDMEKGKNFGLRDWRLGELVDELAQYTDNITIILDCCHSGSGMRDTDDEALTARQAEPDLSPPPPDLKSPTKSSGSESRSADLGGEGFRLSMTERSVLLAACKSTQKAYEFTERPTTQAGDESATTPKTNGAFTMSLSQALACIPPGKVPTYDQLYRTTCRFVSYKSRSQRPQLEGGRERVLFGTRVKPREIWMSVRAQRSADKLFEIDGGLCHGITEGSELTVYQANTRKLNAGKVFCKLRVVDAEAVRCFCEPMDPERPPFLDAPVAVSKLVPSSPKRTVRVEPAVKERLERMNDPLVESIVNLVDDGPSDLVLQPSADGYLLRDSEGRQIDQLKNDAGDHDVASLLNRWARYFAALAVKNDAVGPELSGKVKLRMLDSPTKTVADVIERPADGVVQVQHGGIYRLEVVNESNITLYITILAFTADGEVHKLYPLEAGRRDQLQPGSPYRTGRMRLKIKGDHLTESIDTLKVIATKDETDFSLLCVQREQQPNQPEPSGHRGSSENKVPSSLSQLLQVGAACSNDRSVYEAIDDGEDDTWVTDELTYQLVRPVDNTTVHVLGNQKKEIANSGIAVQAPAGFDGNFSLVSAAQDSHRSLGAPPTPTCLARASALDMEPAPRSRSRSTGTNELWSVEVNSDAGSLGEVTQQAPIKLWLPPGAATDDNLMVVADVGGTPFVVGGSASEADCAQINWIPIQDDTNQQASETSQKAASRGLGRNLKLYIMKQFGQDSVETGLHNVRFIPSDQAATSPAKIDERIVQTQFGEVRYAPSGSADLQSGKKVLLLVHGFQSDSAWLVANAQAISGQYDSVLAFDYESYATPLSENAKILAAALKQAGLKPDDGITVDLISHSAGALVARWMIENEGGHQLVDRCLMFGPLNQGTMLAQGMRLAMWASTLLVGGTVASSWPVRQLSGLLKRTVGEGQGILDLRPKSDFLTKLNASDDRPIVPYHIIAGNAQQSLESNSVLGKVAGVFWSGYSTALGWLKQDQTDLVANVRGMAQIRAGGDFDKQVTSEVVTNHHFNYLSAPEATLQRWRQS